MSFIRFTNVNKVLCSENVVHVYLNICTKQAEFTFLHLRALIHTVGSLKYKTGVVRTDPFMHLMVFIYVSVTLILDVTATVQVRFEICEICSHNTSMSSCK